jgi:hypothetical protein
MRNRNRNRPEDLLILLFIVQATLMGGMGR